MTGGTRLGGSRGRQRPLHVQGGVLEQALGIGHEGVPPVRRPDFEPAEDPDDEGLAVQPRGGPQGRGQEDPALDVELAVDGAAGEKAGEGLGRAAEGGEGAELLFETGPLGRGIGREALIERRDHDRRRRLAEATPEHRGHGETPLGVDSVAISPFEHSELGVFHTFFHFSTLKRTTTREIDRLGEQMRGYGLVGCLQKTAGYY